MWLLIYVGIIGAYNSGNRKGVVFAVVVAVFIVSFIIVVVVIA